MSLGSVDVPPPTRHRRRTGRLARRLIVLAVAVVVVLAGYATYAYLLHRPPPGTTSLVVYTYASLFGATGGNCGSPALDQVLRPFESSHHVAVTFECPPGNLATTLESQRNSPGADLVVGLDEVTAPEAASNQLLVPYRSPALADVPASLVATLEPGLHATPYEWGYLGIDYSSAFWNATHGAVANSSFADFATNTSWASGLLIEDPTNDITGQEFLLWQVEFYEAVLHQNWTGWWKAVAPHAPIAPDWTTAYTEFSSNPPVAPMVVSYTTDAAYAAAAGAPGSINSTVTHYGGVSYGWKAVYGIGIVNGSAHLALDQEFIDWFLSGTVQSAIPANEVEYPANRTIPLPATFAAAVDPSSIVALNSFTTPSASAAALRTYLPEWVAIEQGHG